VLKNLLERVKVLKEYQTQITLAVRAILPAGYIWPYELSVHISLFISLPDPSCMSVLLK
jgi:hypothetical protein